MPRRHITCQWNGQAARLIRNKCRGRAAQRPYVRLRPPAYVTGSRPCDSVGSPPEWGAEAYTVWSRHVSAPDPRMVLIKAYVFFVPEFRDLAVSGPDPTQRGPVRARGGSGPYPEVQSAYTGVRHFPMRVRTHCLWPRGSPRAVHVVGSGAVYHATKIAAWAPCLHTVVRGTPVSGYRQYRTTTRV
jgi:hypothetical protein